MNMNAQKVETLRARIRDLQNAVSRTEKAPGLPHENEAAFVRGLERMASHYRAVIARAGVELASAQQPIDAQLSRLLGTTNAEKIDFLLGALIALHGDSIASAVKSDSLAFAEEIGIEPLPASERLSKLRELRRQLHEAELEEEAAISASTARIERRPDSNALAVLQIPAHVAEKLMARH